MRAVVASGRGVDVGEVADPVPAPGQVLAAPRATGICGSDLHLVHGLAAAGEAAPRVVPGHEFCAEVLEVGAPDRDHPAPDWLAPGRRVVSIPHLLGPHGPVPLGLSPQGPGGFAERMLLQAAWLLPVPDALATDHAALTEPLAVAVHAVAAAPPPPGRPALVVGCGPVGLAVVAVLGAGGHGPVIATDFSPARRRRAELLGADEVLDPAGSSPYTRWADLSGEAPPSPLLPDGVGAAPGPVVYECVGAPGLLAAVADAAPRHTRLVVVGVCTAPDTFTPVTALVKEMTVSFVFAYRREEFATALDLLAGGAVDPEAFLTGAVGLDGVAGALDGLTDGDQVKVLVHP